MHYIQRKILLRLLYAEALTYAAMRPEGVESNHYAYHLEQLTRDGLIVKKDKQYTLSPLGLHRIDRLSQEHMTARLQPHIVTAIDITNEDGQTLLFKRSFQPYIHKYGFPLGKTHYEEDILQAAERELSEKTGLSGVPLQQRGIVYIQAMAEDVIVSKIICHVFQGSVRGTPPVAPLLAYRGESMWLDHHTLEKDETMPGFFAIKEQLANKAAGLFFAEITETL